MIDNFGSKFDAELARWRSRTPHLDAYRDRYLADPTDIQRESIEIYTDSEPF